MLFCYFNPNLNMANKFVLRWYHAVCVIISVLSIGLKTLPAKAQLKLYSPALLSSEQEITDRLSEEDIPTGEGGFARDYFIDLNKGDQVAVDLVSDDFDTIVMLIGADGTKIGENDDGADGSTNSLLFTRIEENGRYIVRVRAFGDTSGGKFTLKVSRLKAVSK